MTGAGGQPSVTVAIPTLNESGFIDRCLESVAAQTYPRVLEVLVVDGGSTDDTRRRALLHEGVRVIDNPRQIQSAALNIAISEAKGEVLVRVDGHCVLDPDYVQECVRALGRTGAGMVGGGMRPEAGLTPFGRAMAVAMRSRLGAGPAHFHTGSRDGWVDSVYLGACLLSTLRAVGGYAEDVGVNEDAELAYRLRRAGMPVWFDSGISSTYTPRSTLKALVRQFFRYGRSRATTVLRHPRSLAPRQLASPLLVAGLASPWRRRVGLAYLLLVGGRAGIEVTRDPAAAARLAVVLPAMHLPWGIGFLVGLTIGPPRPPVRG